VESLTARRREKEEELMDRRTVRRGFAVLAFAAILGVAGAYPAAAEEAGFFARSLRWLSGLWEAQDNGAEASSGNGLFSIWAESDSDKGMGVDPNGGTVQGVTRPPGGEQ
jgi:hypothetical protein